MESPAAPKRLPLIGLSVAAVEAPFLVGMIFVQMLVHCAHCRGVWWTLWPVLPGAIPSVLLGLRVNGWRLDIVFGSVTLLFVAGVFFATFRSRYWRFTLAASALGFSVLAALTHALVAA